MAYENYSTTQRGIDIPYEESGMHNGGFCKTESFDIGKDVFTGSNSMDITRRVRQQQTSSYTHIIQKGLLIITLAVGSSAIPVTPSAPKLDYGYGQHAIKKSIGNKTYAAVQPSEKDDASDNHIIKKSFSLKDSFGFSKIAQWASVLNVERKTIYDWQKNPKKNVHERIAKRIEALDVLHADMLESHRKYLALFSFGKYSDPILKNALIEEPMDKEKLLESYDRLFVKFDGLAVRKSLEIG